MNFFDYLFRETKNLDKDFLIGAKEHISFDNLYTNCLAVAGYLQKYIGTGQNIILVSHNNLFFITTYLGILKSGNVVVPLNPAIEQYNFDYIVNQCGAVLAFMAKNIHTKASRLSTIIDEEGLQRIIAKQTFTNLSLSGDKNLAEIIYTSGSTGDSKGVMLSHKNLIANTASIIEYLNLSETDIMLVVMPFYYCYGLSILHTHLKVGGSIVLNNSFIFLGGILRDLNIYKCTGFAGVPSHYQMLLRKSKSFINTQFPYLRYVTQAGGKLHTIFIEEFRQAFPNIKFYVMYGQTEATARLSYLPPAELTSKLGSIGKGIPDVKLKVINDHGDEVKPGEVGEIVALGKNVMMGYFKDEQLTTETIRNGWLYTGDLATVDDDGYIFIYSRKKDFLKVGGKRISPKEIEEIILLMPEIVDCTVTGIEDELLGEAIKTKIVLNDESKKKITEQDILAHCQKHLALHKIPKYIEFDNTIAMSATGKKIKVGESTESP